MNLKRVSKGRIVILAGVATGVLAVGALGSGCELLVDFNRNLIDSGVDEDGAAFSDATTSDGSMTGHDAAADATAKDAGDGGVTEAGADAAAEASVDASEAGMADAPMEAATPAALSILQAGKDFMSVTEGTASADFDFTLKNTGGSPSGVPVITLGGMDPTQFGITAGATNTCNVALAPGASCTIPVHFAPTAAAADAGVESATLDVTAAPGGAPTATLSGSGTAPAALGITGMNTFPDQLINTTSAATTFTVTNNGAAPSTAPTTAITPLAQSVFMVTANTCTTPLAPLATCSVSVTFKPTAVGPAPAATLTVNAATGGTATTMLGGNGVNPAAITIAPTMTQTFPATALSTSSAPIVFTVSNAAGNARTSALTASILTDTTDFLLGTDGCTGQTLAGGASCTVGAVLNPKSAGVKMGAIQVAAATGGTVSTNLQSLTDQAVFAIAKATEDFGTVADGETTPDLSFVVTNTGSLAATPILALGDPTDWTIGAINTCTSSLAPLATCNVSVHFDPKSTAAMLNTTLTASAAGAVAGSTSLLGAGGDAPNATLYALSATSNSFGPVARGMVGTQFVFTIKAQNPFPTPMTVTLNGNDAAQFTKVADTCTGFQAANPPASPTAPTTCTVTMNFTPQTGSAVGVDYASLYFDSPTGGGASAALTGTAQ